MAGRRGCMRRRGRGGGGGSAAWFGLAWVQVGLAAQSGEVAKRVQVGWARGRAAAGCGRGRRERAPARLAPPSRSPPPRAGSPALAPPPLARPPTDPQELLSTPRFRCYRTADVEGVELGGALKNVLAIACGISDGLGFGSNGRAALITRGLDEITRLAGAPRRAAPGRHAPARSAAVPAALTWTERCVSPAPRSRPPSPRHTPPDTPAVPPPPPRSQPGRQPADAGGAERHRRHRPDLHRRPVAQPHGAAPLLADRPEALLLGWPAIGRASPAPDPPTLPAPVPRARWACGWARARSWPTSRPP